MPCTGLKKCPGREFDEKKKDCEDCMEECVELFEELDNE
jgi:hypothetical protein